MRYIYTVLKLECWKCERTRWYCANCLVVLRNYARWREHWPLSLRTCNFCVTRPDIGPPWRSEEIWTVSLV